jgi:hypothetical protein
VKAECPICAVALEEAKVSTCKECGLTWRVPSPQAVSVPAAPGGDGPRSIAFRPRTGDLLAWTGGFVLSSLIAAAIVGGVIEGDSLQRRELLSALVVLGGAALWWFVVTGWARVATAFVAPMRLRDEGDVISLRSGGLGARGRAERRIAKTDLGDVVLEPVRGVVFQLWVVHRAGPAFQLDAEILREPGERLGGQVRAWLGDRAGGTGYRS